jgi:predicted peptidase
MALYRHVVHYPDGYRTGGVERWPLLIALHGAGERDIAPEVLQTHPTFQSMSRLTATYYPCIVVIPQCPPRQHWEPERVAALRAALIGGAAVDARRIYLTGFSMGGYGTWFTAAAFPAHYAAIAPICGGGNPADAPRLKELPTWAFHGAKDDVVPVEETLEMIAALRATGAIPKLTIYPEGTHAVWDETWANPELYAWLLAHRRNG